MNEILKRGLRDYDAGRYREALSAAEAVLTLSQRQPQARISAELLKAISQYGLDGNLDAGIRALKKLQKRAPTASAVSYQLGLLYGFSGQLDRARAHYERALQLAPNNVHAFQRLAWITKHSGTNPIVEHMGELADRDGLPEQEARLLHNGLAKVFSDMGVHENAFAHALKSKALSPGHYNGAAVDAFIRDLENLKATNAFAGLPPSGNQSERPLFIVGLARSGTTLVEAILGQHRDVRTCGELAALSVIEQELRKSLGVRESRPISRLQAAELARPQELRPHAQAMLQGVHASGNGTYRRFTDKMPSNGLRLGLISRLFPKARIIFLRRDLRDCAVSSLFTLLPQEFAYTKQMDWFGHYARSFYKAVGLWRDMLDMAFLEVSYEALVNDPEPEIRRLLDFAGLEFQPECLHPEAGRDQIRTSSLWQARQSINANSVGRWKNYEPWLGPLFEVLDAG